MIWIALAFAGNIELAHQGRLLDVEGLAVEGTVDLAVALWSDETSTDTENRVWRGTFDNVPASDGYVSVVLGSTQVLPSSVLDTPELWVEYELETPLSPRSFLFRVPYAEVASRVQVAASAGQSCDTEGALVFDRGAQALRVCSGTEWLTMDGVGGHSLIRNEGVYEWADVGAAASCRAYFTDDAYADEGDGMYLIDPDGPHGDGPRQAYCDMTTTPGGWTLVHHGFNGNPVAHGTRYTTVFDANVPDPLQKNDPVNLIPLGGFALVTGANELMFEYQDLSGQLSGGAASQRVEAEGGFSTLFDSPSPTNYVSVVSRERHGNQRVVSSGARLYWGTCTSYLTALRFETFRDGTYYTRSAGPCHMDSYGNGDNNPVNLDFADYTDGNGGGLGTVGSAGWGQSAFSHVINIYAQ